MKNTEIRTIHGHTVEDLLEIAKEKRPDINTDVLQRAFDFAKMAHDGQMRKSGDPYIIHPLAAAITLAQLGLDEATIAATLLHDVPEDTTYTLEDIHKEFGEEIAFLVEGITKLGQLKYRGIDRYVENLRRMFVAMAQDARVIIIKFADRINNLETLQSLPPEKRRRIALESLEIYAPIANRLGMGEMKGLLEDLSFPYVYPEEYNWMKRVIMPQFKETEEMIDRYLEYLSDEFHKRGIQFISMHGRTKHIYSLYKKLLKHDRNLDKIYDLIAVRIIVDGVARCYETLGMVHELCKPLKGRIKDYIAQPKPNGYRSLHTTVFAPAKFSRDAVHAQIVEIQIRTPEMHNEAEFGIASHWQYKEGSSTIRTTKAHRVEWMQQLLDMQDDIHDASQLIDALKIDVFQNYIFVFTPIGDVIELPEDATPVDFAYKIHTELGNKCAGAKVNDHIVSLDHTLRSGDVIEIITDPHRKNPSIDWLEFVKTNTARQHIRAAINRKNKSLIDRE